MPSVRRPRKHRGKRKTKPTQRKDIQGLRMVAVVAVVMNHLTGHPKGGFVGVDVFFVISGYLITGRLLKMLGTRGTATYLADFYKLRVRRIMPAALVVIALTILASEHIFAGPRAHQTAVDGGWAAIFWANWHFITLGTNYFTASGPTSPFQHYWSLAVEEQFYFAWPIALLIVGLLVSKLARKDERRVTFLAGAIAAALLCAGTLAWAFEQSTSNPVSAYFSAFTRGWELGFGALLACLAPRVRAGTWVLTAMSWTGMAVIGVSLFTVSGGSGFPAPGAILPVVGSGLVLAAASGTAHARNLLLTNRVSVHLGDISYSVYLVHFPVIVLLAAEMPHKGGYYYVAAVLLAYGLAVLSWAFVEEPVRDSRFLLASDQRGSAPKRVNHFRPAVAGLLVAVLGLGTYAIWPGDEAHDNARYNAIVAAAAAPSGGTTAPDTSTDAGRLAVAITAALKAQSYPSDLTPSISHALADGDRDICNAAVCAENTSAPHTAVILGDSLAAKLAITARAGLHDQYDVQAEGLAGCPALNVPVSFTSSSARTACQQHRATVLSSLAKQRPDLVMVTDDYGDSFRQSGSDKAYYWQQALMSLIAQLRKFAKQVVIVEPSPSLTSLANCAGNGSRNPTDCVAQPSDLWFEIAAAEKQAVVSQTNVRYLSTFGWYCSASGYCPAFVGHTLERFDNVHMTAAYAYMLRAVLAQALLRTKR